MVASKQLLKDEERAFRETIEGLYPGLLGMFPIEQYVTTLQDKDPHVPYELFPSSIIEDLNQIKVEYGPAASALYHKCSLCRFMQDTLDKLDRDPLPRAIREAYGSWFNRITEDFRTQPDSYYNIDRTLWPLRKDIGICSGRSIPIGGAWVIEKRLLARRAMIRRASRRRRNGTSARMYSSTALRKSLANIMRPLGITNTARHVIRAIRRRLTNHDVCYVIHTIERNILDFSAEQMDLAYRNLASFLEKRSNVWGVYRSSWFLDPAVGDISPGMAFLVQVPLDNGAELHDDGPCPDSGIRKATMMSLERNRLYTSGEYVPRNFFYFWPRDRIIVAFGNDHDM